MDHIIHVGNLADKAVGKALWVFAIITSALGGRVFDFKAYEGKGDLDWIVAVPVLDFKPVTFRLLN